jgi:hypothetical protein
MSDMKRETIQEGEVGDIQKITLGQVGEMLADSVLMQCAWAVKAGMDQRAAPGILSAIVVDMIREMVREEFQEEVLEATFEAMRMHFKVGDSTIEEKEEAADVQH